MCLFFKIMFVRLVRPIAWNKHSDRIFKIPVPVLWLKIKSKQLLLEMFGVVCNRKALSYCDILVIIIKLFLVYEGGI